MSDEPTRREAAVAGHTGDADTARRALDSGDPAVRATGLGALARLGVLTDEEVAGALGDDSAAVRRRAAEITAHRPEAPLLPLLHDDDPMVVEVAAWAAGEHESDSDEVVGRLVELARTDDDPLVRESAVAALGAIGADAGRMAILAALDDKPAVRRRAVLALAPFEGADVDAAIERALDDRDWQVRQAAEDLQRAMR
jgi:HEAT repeat protein